MMNNEVENIAVRLKTEDEWKTLLPNHEMTTAKIGCRICPKLEFTIGGLDPEGMYLFQMKMERADKLIYKYVNGQFETRQEEGPLLNYWHLVTQSGGFRKGSDWMRYGVPFFNLKLTNNIKFAGENCLPVQCGRKYAPVLFVQRYMPDSNLLSIVHQQSFDHAEFIAVFEYKNNEMAAKKKAMRKFGSKNEQIIWMRNMNTPPKPEEIEEDDSEVEVDVVGD